MENPPVTFIWPVLLWLLLFNPIAIVLYVRFLAHRRQLANKSGNLAFFRQASERRFGLRQRLPVLFFLAGLTILIIALARPQMVISLPEMKETVILAFDVSGSMAADDIKPTRLEAAKAVAKDFVQRQPAAVQIGIVAFSDSGFSVQAPTNDQQAILASLGRIQPERGTSLATGINISLDTIAKEAGQIPQQSSDFSPDLLPTPIPIPAGSNSSALIVLITDGENNMQPDPLKAAQSAADRGVKIHTIGIGSPTGANLEVNGFTIHTQLDEGLLKQISQITDGVYYNAQNEDDLRAIYANIKPLMVITSEKTEVTSMLAGLGLLFLLTGGFLTLIWFNRIP